MNTSDWQTTRRTIRGRNQYMFNNTLHSDVEFSVINSGGVTVNIPAHKYVLAIGSPVFEAMFYGDLAESSRNISLPDCTAEGLIELFRYLYYDEADLTEDNAMDVKYTAKKYMVPVVTQKCTQFLEKNLQGDRVLQVLTQSAQVRDIEVQEICWEIIDACTEVVVTTDAFLDTTLETLYDILSRDGLSISELKLFQAVIHWAEHSIGKEVEEGKQISKNDVLSKRLIHQLRLPLIKGDDFIIHVLTANILDIVEIVEIANYQRTLDKSVLKNFKAEERKGHTRRQYRTVTCKRFDASQLYGHENIEHSIIFTTDKQLWLKAVGIYGFKECQYTVDFSLCDDNRPIVQLDQEYIRCSSHSSNPSFVIEMPSWISIEPFKDYTLQMSMKGVTCPSGFGNLTLCGFKGLATVDCEGVKIQFKNTTNKTGTTVEHGQFPQLLFSQELKAPKRRIK